MAPNEQRRHEDQRGQHFSGAGKEKIAKRREYGRYDRRKRRIAKQDRDDCPRRERREAEPWIDRQQDSARGGYALSALKTEEHRKEVAQKHRDRADSIRLGIRADLKE